MDELERQVVEAAVVRRRAGLALIEVPLAPDEQGYVVRPPEAELYYDADQEFEAAVDALIAARKR